MKISKLKTLLSKTACVMLLVLIPSWSHNAAAQSKGSEIFGTYNNGCIRGAVPLNSGEHYQVLIYGEGRNYGHPSLIDFVHKLVQRSHAQGLPDLLISDMSKHYGGPFGAGSAHGSHNIGLDVDVSFDFASPRKSGVELRNPKDIFMVDTKQRPTVYFTRERAELIRLATQDPRVERIFVAPGIKRGLCELYRDSDRSWLRKVRPWFGHRAHMHVRLQCPADSPYCKKQLPPPAGDGCGEELASWFKPPKPAAGGKKTVTKPKPRVLPGQCRAVLQGR
ncbi:MAG: penicillin-insensitive murein endopeptidase [Succinivibrio sp.]|nr:penicillin-insensitive murein endopeptidase [Succinivibrio sp.]